MNVSDYIVQFFTSRGIEHFFGYQGTMISYFVDAIGRNNVAVNHSCYNEQGAAFAACGLAQATKRPAVAYATSGPGAVNLVSGIANAYYDSLPVIFITGQVNTYEYLPETEIRQHSFQEIDIVSISEPVTKYAVKITEASQIKQELEKAYSIATSGRPGAVLIDIPMNIQREIINPSNLPSYTSATTESSNPAFEAKSVLESLLASHKRPVFLLGNGVSETSADLIAEFARKSSIPVITTLLGKGLLSEEDDICFGYLGGAYGIRCANMIAAKKADLLICFGTSLVTRQTGTKVNEFAPDATMFRIDIDPVSFARKIGKEHFEFCCDVSDFAQNINSIESPSFEDWLRVCRICRNELAEFDEQTPERFPNRFIKKIHQIAPSDAIVASDVGQHMMWIAQSYKSAEHQRFLFSGGHGAMGYALPAAIGASYASDAQVLSFAGDGAFQMNIQELEWIAREQLPIKQFVLNNHALGMVRVQQKVYFDYNYEGTSMGYNYSTPDFASISKAYALRTFSIDLESNIEFLREVLHDDEPAIIVVDMPEDSFAYPKTLLGNPVYNQEPELPKELLESLINL